MWLRGTRKLSLTVVEKAAHQLAGSFSIEQIGKALLKAWSQTPKLEELRKRAHIGHTEVEKFLRELKIPELPAPADLKHKAQKMFAHIPSLNPIVERAHQIMIQSISVWLVQGSQRDVRTDIEFRR